MQTSESGTGICKISDTLPSPILHCIECAVLRPAETLWHSLLRYVIPEAVIPGAPQSCVAVVQPRLSGGKSPAASVHMAYSRCILQIL